MRTVSTLLVSASVVAALLTGASMAMRSDAAPNGTAQASRGPEGGEQGTLQGGAPAQAWANPPGRAPAAPAAADSGIERASDPAERRIEAANAPKSEPATPRPLIRRGAARAEAPKRAEIPRPQRRMAQASLRPRGPAPRANSSEASLASPQARPVDPISDFLRGVGLIEDDHG